MMKRNTRKCKGGTRMKYKKTSSIIREYTDSYSKLCTESCTVPKELYSSSA